MKLCLHKWREYSCTKKYTYVDFESANLVMKKVLRALWIVGQGSSCLRGPANLCAAVRSKYVRSAPTRLMTSKYSFAHIFSSKAFFGIVMLFIERF